MQCIESSIKRLHVTFLDTEAADAAMEAAAARSEMVRRISRNIGDRIVLDQSSQKRGSHADNTSLSRLTSLLYVRT